MVIDERMPYAPYPAPTGTAVAAAPSPVASPHGSGPWFLARANLGVLIDLLREDGRTVIGPKVMDGAVAYGEIQSVDELPAGIGDEQSPGQYRLVKGRHRRIFDYAVGPLSPKRWTFPPVVPLNVGRRDGKAITFEPAPIDPPGTGVPRRPGLRAGRAGDPGPRVPGWTVHGRGLPGEAPQRPRDRGQLHLRRFDVFLHLHGHGPGGARRL